MSALVNFYRGTGFDQSGRSIESIWNFSRQEWEEHHDFIQWIFPLNTASRFNVNAPVLTTEDMRVFCSDPRLQSRLRDSLRHFLAFLGLAVTEGKVAWRAEVDPSGVLAHPNHNWLRITRVLTSLRLLGLTRESELLFHFLEDLHRSKKSGVTEETFRYWELAMQASPPR